MLTDNKNTEPGFNIKSLLHESFHQMKNALRVHSSLQPN